MRGMLERRAGKKATNRNEMRLKKTSLDHFYRHPISKDE
jgi:hypothetical protein